MSRISVSAKKTVVTSFEGNEEVLQHIVLQDLKRQNKRPLRTFRAVLHPESTSEEDDDDDTPLAFLSKKQPRKSFALEADEKEISGQQIFGFHTPRSSKKMAEKVAKQKETPRKKNTPTKQKETPKKDTARKSSVLTETPKKITRSNTPKSRTPVRSTRVKRSGRVTNNTPVKKRSSTRQKRLAQQTPQRISKRKQLEKECESDSSDSGQSDKETAEDDNNNNKEDKQEELPQPSRTEDYFEAQSSAATTSDHTLNKLNCPRLTQEELVEEMRKLPTQYQAEKQKLMEKHKKLFPEWMVMLMNGFNIVVHGVGSKLQLLSDFHTEMLKDFTCLVINGFFPSLSVKSILNTITEEILEHSGSFRNMVDQVEFIRHQCELEDYGDVYLLIHNIDGPILRTEKHQAILSQLALVKGFHVIASIDHINAPLLWDHFKISRFNFLWYECVTMALYTQETSYENSLLLRQSGDVSLSSLLQVFKSLTPNAKRIFTLLAEHQLSCADDQRYQGLPFTELYQKCWEKYLVNSDLTLKAQLTEFLDHKLIKMKKGSDGVEYLVVTLENSMIQEFLTQQEN